MLFVSFTYEGRIHEGYVLYFFHLTRRSFMLAWQDSRRVQTYDFEKIRNWQAKMEVMQ
jgi:hypothetical protein